MRKTRCATSPLALIITQIHTQGYEDQGNEEEDNDDDDDDGTYADEEPGKKKVIGKKKRPSSSTTVRPKGANFLRLLDRTLFSLLKY